MPSRVPALCTIKTFAVQRLRMGAARGRHRSAIELHLPGLGLDHRLAVIDGNVCSVVVSSFDQRLSANGAPSLSCCKNPGE